MTDLKQTRQNYPGTHMLNRHLFSRPPRQLPSIPPLLRPRKSLMPEFRPPHAPHARPHGPLRSPSIALGFLLTFTGFIIFATAHFSSSIRVAYFACFIRTWGIWALSVLLSTWYNSKHGAAEGWAEYRNLGGFCRLKSRGRVRVQDG